MTDGIEIVIPRCPGPAERARHWVEANTFRANLTIQIQEYLEEDACVPGAPKSGFGINAYVDRLCEGLNDLVRLELDGHSDDVESLRSMRAIASVFSELWRVVAGAPLPASLHFNLMPEIAGHSLLMLELDEANKKAKSVKLPKDLESTATLVGLIGAAFSKALAEAQVAADRDDGEGVLHHKNIMSEYINEALNICQYMKPRDERDFTEYLLVK